MRHDQPPPHDEVPRCSGMRAQVRRNACPGHAGMGAQVAPESVVRSARNTHPIALRAGWLNLRVPAERSDASWFGSRVDLLGK